MVSVDGDDLETDVEKVEYLLNLVEDSGDEEKPIESVTRLGSKVPGKKGSY